MKKPSLFLVFLVSLAVCACENPLMANILQKKTITFYSNGAVMFRKTILKNERISRPEDPVLAGFFFSGWFTYNGTFYKGWDFNDIPEGDMDLYACWTTDWIGNLEIWNFDIKGVGTVIFDGYPKMVTVTPRIDIKVYSVYYEGVNGTEYPKTTNTPIDPGTYRVTFDGELNIGWYLELEAGMLTIIEEIDSINNLKDLADLLSVLAANTASTPHTIPLKINDSDILGIKKLLLDEWSKFVYLDFSNSSIATIPDYAFFYIISDDAVALCYNLTGIIMPDSVKSIGNAAFRGCENLTNVTIGNGVKTIGNEAFRYCISLKSITIPNTVTSIGAGAFSLCSGLTSVTIGNQVISIGNSAFYDCSNLISVTIPNSVELIGDNAFYYCNNLTSVTFNNNTTTLGDNAFPEGDNLRDKYLNGGAGTYNKTGSPATWIKQQ